MAQSQKATAEKSETAARASQEAKPARLHESAKQSTPVGTPVGRDGAVRDVHQSGLPHSRLMQLQRSIGNQAVSRLLRSHVIQAKLEIGAVDDPLEREADHVAERVMCMTEPAPLSSSASAAVVQRKCTECEEEEEQRTLRRKCQSCSDGERKQEDEGTPGKVSRKKSAGAAALDGTDAPPIIREVLRSPGQPLDKTTRDFFEPRFGRDLGQVRLHANAAAADSARAVRAKAYTVGNHIAFAAGQHSASSTEGRRLLAHELTHCLQQQPDRATSTAKASRHSSQFSESTTNANRANSIASLPTPRVSRVPTTTADFAVTGKKDVATDTMNLYFEQNSSTLDGPEKAKIPKIITAAPGPLVLNGFISEDEPVALAGTRAGVVDTALGAAVPPHIGTRTTHALPAQGVGQIGYRDLRKVEVLAAPTSSPPPVSAVPSCAAGSTTACGTAFSTAQPLALTMVNDAITALGASPLAANTTSMLSTLFGDSTPATLSTVKGNLAKLVTHLTAMPTQMRCHNACDATCTRGAYNCGVGVGVPAADPCTTTGSKAMMTLCPEFLNEPAVNERAQTLIHEGSHGTAGLETDDFAYGVTRGIILLSHAKALKNTDSYVLLVRNLHTPGSVSIGPSPADTITGSGSCPTADPAACKALANLENWAVTANGDISDTYDAVRQALPPGSWSVSYSQQLLHKIAPLFGLTDPGAGPHFTSPVNDDKVKLAGIYDRYTTMMYQVYVNQVTVNKVAAGSEKWTFGRPASVDLQLPMTGSPVAQVRHLFELLVEATSGISAALRPSYVEAADRIRKKRGYGP